MAFKTGNIVRVSVENFLTFNCLTVTPKPYLNIIIGPNGAGKSTILCAICICLGGKPDVTGRSKNLESYVKHGKDSATLEVELYVEGKSNVVIKREFGKASQWYLQGKAVSKREIDTVVRKFGIQVDNLCTFLPQDRVASFARMNPINLLEATEKAVGDPQLFEHHDILCSSGTKMKEAKSKSQSWVKEIDTLQKQNARLKEIVESVQEKKKLEDDIDFFEKQRIYHHYEKKRVNTNLLQSQVIEKDENVKNEEKLLRPLNKQIEQCNDSILLQRRTLNNKIIRYNEVYQKVNRIRTLNEKLQEESKALAFDFEAKKEAAQQQLLDLENHQKQLDVYQRQYESLPAADEEEVRKKMQKLTQDISSGSTKLADICNEIEELSAEIRDNKRRIQGYQTQLEAAKDVRQQRFELLRKKNGDAYKAAKWLEENKEQFTSPFYMPICILINLRDSAYADVVESTISFSDLIAFVFHDKEDMNKFKSFMDRLKIRVNIIHSAPSDLSSYKSPFPINMIRHWGFDTYMSDVIDAPPAILSYLHKQYKIHSIPIARKNEIPTSYDNLPDHIALFFIGRLRVFRSRSRYDNERITESSSVREGSLLKIIYDYKLITGCEEGMAQCQQRNGIIDKDIEELNKQERELSAKLSAWRNDKQGYLSREQTRVQLQKRISAKQAQIKKCETQKFDEQLEENQMQNKLRRIFKSRLSCLKEGEEMIAGTALAEYFKLMGEMKSKGLYVKNMKEIIDQKGEKLKSLKEEKVRMEGERSTVKKEALELLKQLCSAVKVKRYDEIPQELIVKFSRMTLEETENKLCDLKARRDCLLTADEQEIIDFNERETTISSLQNKLKDFQEKSCRHHEEIEKVRSLWLPSVTDLIQNISSSFTGFMERLGCSGEVELIHEDEHDYSKYGIAIYVKFRGADKLRVLTAQHQSGGERALATALYMLSLQNLTSVPFRCVDEINQGMDPVNERMMLSMLIETAAKEESSQYFFVSPKLLRGLEYSDRVNTMVVFNGPANVPRNQFSIKACIRLKEKKKSRD